MEFINYLMATATVIISLYTTYSSLRRQKVGFLEGIQIGFTFFVALPLLSLLIYGNIEITDLPQINKFGLEESADATTLLLLLLFGIIFSSFTYAFRSSYPQPKNVIGIAQWAKYSLLFYFCTALVSFIYSGKIEGGHWAENTARVFEQNPLAVLIANFHNVFRIFVPGILLCWVRYGKLKEKYFYGGLFVLCILELIISSNRIIILLALLAIIINLKARLKPKSFALLMLSPAIIYFNHLFPIVRGLLWTDGAKISSMADAFVVASLERSRDGSNLKDGFTSAFESANVVLIKYVVENFPDKYDFFLGSTVFLKSFSFIIPRSIWPEKPVAFGGFLGREITGIDILTLNSTLIGESFANFGWGSLIILPFSIYFLNKYYFCSKDLRIQYFGFFVAFSAWRFDFSFFIVSIFCFAVFMFAYKKMVEKTV